MVTKNKAALWTDGRYFLQVLSLAINLNIFAHLFQLLFMINCSVWQAEKELNHHWTLMRSGNHGVPTTSEWLNDVLPSGCRVGIDPVSFSLIFNTG